MRLFAIPLLLTILLTGCVAPPSGAAEPGPAPTAVPEEETAAPSAEQVAAAPVAAPAATVTELTFAGNGDTFLEHIEDVWQNRGQPEAHDFVELAAGGLHWQGEALTYPDKTVVLLQPRGSGGSIGLEVQITPDGGATPDTGLTAVVAEAGLTMGEEILRPDPEIRFVRARQTGDGVWSFDVTLAYPDTGREDYADGWHVATPAGEILATRILLHPHVGEQPFTRGQGGVTVPAGVEEVIIRTHTLVRGYGEATLAVPLDEAVETDRFAVIR